MAENQRNNFAPNQIVQDIVIAGLIAGLIDGLRDWLRAGGKEAGGAVGEKVYKRLIEEKRSELLAFIHELAAHDPTASKNIFSWQQARQECKARTYGKKEPYLPGDEDQMVFLLTKLYIAIECIDKADKNTCGEKKRCVAVFKWLGNLSDEEFDSRIEFLNHDAVIQWLQRMKVWGKDVIGSVNWSAIAANTDKKVANGVKMLREKLAKRGIK